MDSQQHAIIQEKDSRYTPEEIEANVRSAAAAVWRHTGPTTRLVGQKVLTTACQVAAAAANKAVDIRKQRAKQIAARAAKRAESIEEAHEDLDEFQIIGPEDLEEMPAVEAEELLTFTAQDDQEGTVLPEADEAAQASSAVETGEMSLYDPLPDNLYCPSTPRLVPQVDDTTPHPLQGVAMEGGDEAPEEDDENFLLGAVDTG